MKIRELNLEKIYLPFTIALNFYLFLLTYLQYSSHRGTDFDIYGNYLNYHIFGFKQTLQEQTVGYFSLVSLVSKTKIEAMKISVDYKELIYNYGIQTANYLFFIIGLFGIYKILNFLDVNKFHSLTIINLLSLFPPLVGLRMILKPEIVAFAFLPWVIYLIFIYKNNKELKYIIMLLPLISMLLSLKSSITLMIGLTILIFFGKDALKKEIILLGFGSVLIMSLLLFESYQITDILVWDHKTPPGYNYKAPVSFLYNINTDIWNNPFRDSQAKSMLGILLLDTFGDYWERYWFHSDGYIGRQNFNIKSIINLGSTMSFIFYSFSVCYLLKDKNNLLKKIGTLGYVGLFVMIINSHNLIPFLTKNFNPGKGDPMKTHYFSFLLAFTFIYLYLKLFQNRNKIFSIVFLIFISTYSFMLLQPIGLNEIKSNQSLMNKVHILSPCSLGDPINTIINYSHSWCEDEAITIAICEGNYNENLIPIDKDGYLVFPPDESYRTINLVQENNVVTVNNYYECLNYTEGGFLPASSANYFVNGNTQSANVFNLIFLLSCLSIIYTEFIFKNNDKN